MKRLFCSAALFFVMIAPSIARAATDCALSASALLPYEHSQRATRGEWRASHEAVESLMTCAAGPADVRSRALFFQFVEKEFTYNYNPRYEGESESIRYFQRDLQRYMDSIVDSRDLQFKSVILNFGGGKAISALGPSVRNDVLRMAKDDSRTFGYSRHEPQQQAFMALGYWIDPANVLFTPQEKHEMTDVLLAKLSTYSQAPHVGQPYATANAVLTALAHSDSPDAETVLQRWARNPNSSLQEVARQAAEAVRKRLRQDR